MNLDHVKSLRFAPTVQTYDWRDCALYAMSLGMGSDPLDEDELPYVYEHRMPQAVPSQCVTMGWQPFWQDDPATGIDWVRILHGEMGWTLHRPLPIEATVRVEHELCAVEDKGQRRGVILHFEHRISDMATGVPMATLHSLQFLRGDGGCGSHGVPFPASRPLPPELQPTGHVDYQTVRQAALLYRLASRDWMPIHADPGVARQAGFDRPISHGLNTMGLACRAILKHFLPGQSQRLMHLSVRFAAAAYPGETIRIEWFEQENGLRFRARVLERDVLVLDRGVALWR